MLPRFRRKPIIFAPSASSLVPGFFCPCGLVPVELRHRYPRHVLPARTQHVKYILTDTGTVVVDEIVAPTQSTMAGWFELLPFKVVVSLLLVM